MTTTQEALKMAIEAMIKCGDRSKETGIAINACKEALEQGDRVYTNTNHGFTLKDRHFYTEGNGGIWDENFDYDASLAVYGDFENDADKKQYAQMICDALNAQREALEQQEQEPVAWTTEFDMTNIWESPESPGAPFTVPLYTHPAKQLTDDEIWEWFEKNTALHKESALFIARAIEAKIR